MVAAKNKAGRNLALAEAAYETEPTPGTALHLAEPIIKTYLTGTLAEFSAAYTVAGGFDLDVVRAGLLAAAMADRDDAFAILFEQATNSRRRSG